MMDLTALNPDSIGLCESNVPWTAAHRDNFKAAFNPIWPYHRPVFASCPLDPSVPLKGEKQQGGVAQLIHGSHSGRVIRHEGDYLGRWATQILRLKGGRTMAILTAYRPCKDSLTTATPGTVLMQQYRELRRRGVLAPDPRKQFLKDLTAHVNQLQGDGHAILLGLDANLSRPDAEFETFLDKCELRDLLAEKYPNPTATHTKGNRLDLLLGCSFVAAHVIAVGVLDSTQGPETDHAVLFVDLDTRIFSKKNLDPTSPSQRGFWLQDETRAKRFRKRVNDALEKNDQLKELESQLDSALDPILIETLCNAIDDILTDTILAMESKVRRRTQHAPPWSIKYRDARNEVRSWNDYLRRMKRTQQIVVPIPAQVAQTYAGALHYVVTKLKEAWKRLRAIKKEAYRHRQEFLRERVKAHEQEGHPEKAEAVRKQISKEAKRQTFRKFRYAYKGSNGSGLTKVIRPDEHGNDEEVTEVDDLFEALLTRNKKHFGQARETDMAKPPYSDILPPFDSSNTEQEILHGDLSSFPTLDPILQEFLKQMEIVIPELFAHDMTVEQFRDGMKKAPEGKSSSLSGRHYGIYKALLDNDHFTGLVVRLLNLGVQHSFILQRWRKVLQVMLQKEEGNHHIDRLRVIQLIEADINMYFRLVWGKRLVRQALNNDRIPVEQFGSKPGALAMSAVILKVCSFDLIRLTRSQATIFNNDASACYDRILPILSQICCQRLGLPPIAAKFQLEFLKAAEYHVKTQHGVSDEWFGNAISEVYGVLQGSGSAPAIWLAVSIVLINSYNALFPTTGIPDPQNMDRIQKVIDAFVDDTDLWDILFDEPLSDEEAIARMQERAQTWEKLMFASGGKLNLKKCYWYYVSWDWVNGMPFLRSLEHTPGNLTIISSVDNQPKVITRIDTASALKTLGIWTSPSGSNKDQMKSLRQTLKGLVRATKSIPLTTEEAAIVIPVYIVPKLRYIFSGTTLTMDECSQLDKLYLPTLKSLMGFKRTTRLEVMHGSYRYGGAQLPTCWDLQGSTHSNLLIGHLQLNDIVGRHLRHAIDYLYLLIGHQEPPLSYPIEDAKVLAVPSWVTNTWHFTSSIHARLVTSTLRLHPQRQHDVTIMNAATRLYNGITLLRINAVRLYLGLTFLSDLTKSDGKTLDKTFLYLDRTRRRQPHLTWPHQEEPGKTAWSEWRSMFKKCHTHPDFTLRTPLGPWLVVPKRTQQWHTLIDHATSDVFVKNGPLWHLYRTPTRAKTLISFVDVLTWQPPPTALPISLEKVKDKFRCLPYVQREVQPAPYPPPVTTFRSFLRSRPAHERWVFGHVLPQSPSDVNDFLHAIQTGDFYLGSDGSVRGLATTYASRIQSHSTLSVFITSHSRAEPTCTLRAEAYGYLGALYLLRAAVRYLQHFGHPIPNVTSNQYMDNTGVLTRLSYGPPVSVKYNTARHSDVLREILQVEASLPFTIQRHHVKSHQSDDADVLLEDLSPPVRINKMCDTSCTLAHTCDRCRPPTAPPIFPSTKAYLLIDDTPYSSKLNVDLLYLRNDVDLRNYIIEKEHWDIDIFDTVHWPSIQTALYRTTSEGRKAATKLTFKLWATNEEMSLRTRKHKDRVDHRCSRCSRLHETYDHIFHCPASRPIIAQAMDTLHKFLRRSMLAPVMIRCILHGLTTYLRPRQPPYDFSQHPQDDFLHLVRWAYTQQSEIGWSNLLRGRLATSWLCAHDDYHRQRRLHGRHSSARFAPAFVQELWSFSLTVWHQRNHHVHGATVADFNAIQLVKINRKIIEAYADPDLLHVTDQPIAFSQTLDQRLSTTLRAKVRWYSFYESCLNAPDLPTETPAQPPPELAAFFRPFQQFYRRMAAPPEVNPFNPAT